jgi:hypothetical protein
MAGFNELFGQAMQRLNTPQPSTYERAKQVASDILQQQRTQRAAPLVKALDQFKQQYANATDDAGRQQANTLASQARNNYLAGGGSPMDLDISYWGADPTQGFQTTGGYQSPITGYENMARQNVIDIKRQAMIDALTKRSTIADITGIDPDTGEKTWGRQYQEQALAKSGSGGYGGYGGGGSGGSTSSSDLEKEKAELASQLYSGKINRDSAIDRLQKSYQAGLISFEDTNALLHIVDVFAPAPAPAYQGESKSFLETIEDAFGGMGGGWY